MNRETSRLGLLGRRGYFGKFVFSFVGIVVLVLVVNGALETWFMYRETTQLVVKSGSEKAEAIARRVEQFIAELERQISWATRASTTTIEQRRADYELLMQQVPAIDRAIYLDSSGREQVRLTPREFVTESNLDYSGDPRFRESQGRASWRSPVYFNGRDPIHRDAVAPPAPPPDRPSPEVNLKFLADYLDRGQIDLDTEAYIIERFGRLLATFEVRSRSRHQLREFASGRRDPAGRPGPDDRHRHQRRCCLECDDAGPRLELVRDRRATAQHRIASGLQPCLPHRVAAAARHRRRDPRRHAARAAARHADQGAANRRASSSRAISVTASR